MKRRRGPRARGVGAAEAQAPRPPRAMSARAPPLPAGPALPAGPEARGGARERRPHVRPGNVPRVRPGGRAEGGARRPSSGGGAGDLRSQDARGARGKCRRRGLLAGYSGAAGWGAPALLEAEPGGLGAGGLTGPGDEQRGGPGRWARRGARRARAAASAPGACSQPPGGAVGRNRGPDRRPARRTRPSSGPVSSAGSLPGGRPVRAVYGAEMGCLLRPVHVYAVGPLTGERPACSLGGGWARYFWNVLFGFPGLELWFVSSPLYIGNILDFLMQGLETLF